MRWGARATGRQSTMKERSPARAWASSRWQALVASYDADEIAAMSGPRFIVPHAAVLIGILLAVAYAPGADSGFRRPWVSVCLMLGAAGLASLAHRRGARGLGSVATLMDNGFL